MAAPIKRDARRAPGASVETKQQKTSRKPTGGRPVLQGNANARNPSQRAPRWSPPRGADALAEMEALFPTLAPIQRRRR